MRPATLWPRATCLQPRAPCIHVSRGLADLFGMAPGLDFAHILDQKIDDARQAAARRAGGTPLGRFWTADPALSIRLPGNPVRSASGRRAYPPAGVSSPARTVVVRSGAPSRVLSLRTAVQREAADVIERLGGPRFGRVCFEDEVKGAYRVLARRLHPDAHPTALPEERRRLAAAFASLSTAYRTLVA